jgi:ribosomal protein S18 acetylase RimI-like enzyme
VGSQVQFVQVTEVDVPALYELRRAGIRAGCVGHYSSAQIDAWTNPLSDIGLQKSLPEHSYFAKIDDEIVACGMLDVATGRIDGIIVSPSHFRRGIGRAMMQHLERVARDYGVKHLVLDASLNAVDFYRSQGFQGDAVSSYYSPRGITLECVPMFKSLEIS